VYFTDLEVDIYH